ncbi:M23 family metallopeptidase [Xylanimonas ulmi]|uniref:Peptidase M23-like protein n=1 Tax=Xylanimonas ulmi TaxID=228973 RepID=A0A4Q7M363_9MICO|nr:M23 family metallopeptidase [Xylanibacterium ulmi]RZS61403.1 peptidase M23-like protein [Xylanibacterium ulmi]
MRRLVAAVLPALLLAPTPSPLGYAGEAPPQVLAAATRPAVATLSASARWGRVASAPHSGRGYAPPVPGALARGFDPPAVPWEAGHRGVDLWSPPGAIVVAPGAGQVTFAGSVAGKPVVVVTHVDGLRSSLEPVAATLAAGTTVAVGEAVGVAAWAPADRANPDHCAGLRPVDGAEACVHWGVRRGDRYLDPLTLLGMAPPIVLLPPR